MFRGYIGVSSLGMRFERSYFSLCHKLEDSMFNFKLQVFNGREACLFVSIYAEIGLKPASGTVTQPIVILYIIANY